MSTQAPPTESSLMAGDARMMEQIAHNLCSLHDFDVALVAGLERFAKAVITEYERARPATSAASEGDDWGRYARAICESEGKQWMGLENSRADCERWFAAGRAVAALASPTVSERERELEGALAWYGEQARLARLIHSEGDAGRHALAADGGKRASALLIAQPQEPV